MSKENDKIRKELGFDLFPERQKIDVFPKTKQQHVRDDVVFQPPKYTPYKKISEEFEKRKGKEQND